MWLLQHQTVQSKFLPGRLWVVQRGSGMGLKHSASVMDAALYSMVEKPWNLNPVVRGKHQILQYFRFRDDLWLLAGQRDSLRVWFEVMRRRGPSTFRFECVSHSKVHCVMLAVAVVKNKDGTFSCKPRPLVHDGPLLSSSSCHHPHVRKSWPAGVLQGICRISSPDLRVEAMGCFISRLQRFFTPPQRLAKLRHYAITLARCGPSQRKPSCADPSKVMESWMVLPYHPAYRFAALAREFRILQECPLLRSLFLHAGFKQPCTVRASWKNQLKPLMQVVHSIGLSKALEIWRRDGEVGGWQQQRSLPVP